jgi:quercetin dioxygenase-like cupin family protein
MRFRPIHFLVGASGVIAAVASTYVAAQALGNSSAARPVQGDAGVFSSTVLDEAMFRTGRNYAAPGATRSLHRHGDVSFHIFILATGTLRLEIEGEGPRIIGAGEIVSIPAGSNHTFTNIGGDTATFIEVFGKPPA